jgi:hypothetical protein
MFDGVIVDGVSGTGKTTLFNALKASRALASVESTYNLSQVYTLRVARPERAEKLAYDIVRQLEELHAYYSESEFSQRVDGRGDFRFLFEGFHHHLALDYLPESSRKAFVRAIDERLVALGARLVALYVPRERMLDTVRLTLRYRGEKWRRYIMQFGDTEEQIAALHQARQDEYLEMVDQSPLPVLRLETSGRDWPSMVGRIEEFLGLPPGGRDGER